MSKRKLMEDVKQDPARFYRLPSDVIRDRRFNDSERVEILQAWARSVQCAEGESGEAPDLLKRLEDARQEIERKRPQSER